MKLVISIALFLIMMSLGLNLPPVRFGILKERPLFLARVLITTCIGIPFAAVVLLQSPIGETLTTPITTGLMLMAICPSAPMITLKSSKLAATSDIAIKLQFWSACAAIISVPLWIGLLASTGGGNIWNISSQEVASQVFTVQLIPLLVGVSLRKWCSEWAERWNPWIQKIATLLLVVLLILILATAVPAGTTALLGNARGALAMLLLTWIGLAAGYAVAGKDTSEKSTVPLVISMRNPGLALLLVQDMAPDASNIKAAVAGYVLMTVIGTAPFMKWRKALHSSNTSTTAS
mgnify:CR=1 FL=1